MPRDISFIKFMWTFTENRNTPNIQCMVYLPSKIDILKGKIKCRYLNIPYTECLDTRSTAS